MQEILAAINLPFFVGEEIWRAKGSTAALPRGDHSFFERQKSPVWGKRRRRLERGNCNITMFFRGQSSRNHGLEHFDFFHILGIIIPTDFHFFRGIETTNQSLLSSCLSTFFDFFKSSWIIMKHLSVYQWATFIHFSRWTVKWFILFHDGWQVQLNFPREWWHVCNLYI